MEISGAFEVLILGMIDPELGMSNAASLYGSPHRSFYTKEILRLTGMGVATIKRELDCMLAAGILTMTPIGNQHHYQANPQCPIYTDLVNIVSKTLGVVVLSKPRMDVIGSANVVGE